MSVLSRVVESLGLKSTFAKGASATSRNEGNNLPDIDAAKWGGEDILRQLAADHKDGQSEWKIAATMARVFPQIDAFNEKADDQSKISIHVSRRFHEFFDLMVMLGCHKSTDAQDNHGPEDIGQEFLVKRGDNIFPARFTQELEIETDAGWTKFRMPHGPAAPAYAP